MQQDQNAYSESTNTDMEIWRETSTYSRALIPTGPRAVAKYTLKQITNHNAQRLSSKIQTKTHCQRANPPNADGKNIHPHTYKYSFNEPADDPSPEKSQNASYDLCQNDLVDSALPAVDNKQQRMIELQKLKANCKPEALQKLKSKCEILIRDCIEGLIIQLSIKDFKEIEGFVTWTPFQNSHILSVPYLRYRIYHMFYTHHFPDELNRAICWYLTCDRYWEDSHSDIKQFPWGLLCMIIMVLSLGICFCYYIIWVLFEYVYNTALSGTINENICSTDDISVTSTSITDRSTPSPAHVLKHETSTSSDGHQTYTEDYYTNDKDNEYIYVTYPPDLKRRLLER